MIRRIMKSNKLFTQQIIFLIVILFVQALVLAQQPPAYRYTAPAKMKDGIRTGTLKDAGLDEAKIVAGTNEILIGTYPNIHSLLIFRDGKLVFEEYFTGEDVERGVGPVGVVKHTRETLHDMRSVTKSIVAIAVLIAHSQGKIKSLDQPIFEFFPEYVRYAEGDKKKITIKHVLSMTAGLDWNERISYADPMNSEIQMERAANSTEYVLSQKLVEKPGAVFNYSGGLSQLLAEIVKRTTGSDIAVFTEKNLFAPLGITKYKWVNNRNGGPSAASGLRLRSRDMAKIGMLLMNKGKWEGNRIIPAKLVEEAMQEHVKLVLDDTRPQDLEGYGYQIWRLSTLINGDRADRVEFSGNGGQKVQIDTANKLMVVVTAGNYNKRGLKKSSRHIYEDIVYPALLDRKPAQVNKAKAAKP
jgi:CubicO group peptidase (beta-lactamase class C family)